MFTNKKLIKDLPPPPVTIKTSSSFLQLKSKPKKKLIDSPLRPSITERCKAVLPETIKHCTHLLIV